MSISTIIGLFNIVVGVMFVFAVVYFVAGIIIYTANFGNAERTHGVISMEWGTMILFVLVVLLGIVQFLQGHTGVANLIAAAIGIGFVGYFLYTAFFAEALAPKKEEKK